MPFAGARMAQERSGADPHPTPRPLPENASWTISRYAGWNFFPRGYAGLRVFHRQRLEKENPKGYAGLRNALGSHVGSGGG
jgi:hypothetical protein